jgi:membrane protein required for colicin V production
MDGTGQAISSIVGTVFTSLTLWDYVAGLIALISIGFGIWKGLVKTVFGLSAWALAIAIPLYFGQQFFTDMGASLGISLPLWVFNVLLGFGVFVGVQLLGLLVARLLGKVGLGGLDRLLGAFLGAGRAIVILAVVVVIAGALGAPRTQAWQQARTKPLLNGLLNFVNPLLQGEPATRASAHLASPKS